MELKLLTKYGGDFIWARETTIDASFREKLTKLQ